MIRAAKSWLMTGAIKGRLSSSAGPQEEAADSGALDRALAEPGVQVVLCAVGQVGAAVVEPLQQSGSVADLHPDGPGSAVGDQLACGLVAESAQGLPVRVVAQDPAILDGRDTRDGLDQPVLQDGQLFVPGGKGAGGDQRGAQVSDGGCAGEAVEDFVSDWPCLCRQGSKHGPAGGDFMGLFCWTCGCDHVSWRRGSVGRLPPRQSMTSAMIASALRKPKPRRMIRRVLVFVDSISPLLNSSTIACRMAS